MRLLKKGMTTRRIIQEHLEAYGAKVREGKPPEAEPRDALLNVSENLLSNVPVEGRIRKRAEGIAARRLRIMHAIADLGSKKRYVIAADFAGLLRGTLEELPLYFKHNTKIPPVAQQEFAGQLRILSNNFSQMGSVPILGFPKPQLRKLMQSMLLVHSVSLGSLLGAHVNKYKKSMTWAEEFLQKEIAKRVSEQVEEAMRKRAKKKFLNIKDKGTMQ